MNTNLSRAHIIRLPKINDPRGNLSVLEEEKEIPFKIKRTYWIYDVPGGEIRGANAFIEQQVLIIVLSGSLDVVVFDGIEEKKFSLNRSYFGLYLPNRLWYHMENFATNTLTLVVSSSLFKESDYIRNIDEFIKLQQNE